MSQMNAPRIWTVWTAVGLALFFAILFQVIFTLALVLIELGNGTSADDLGDAILKRMASPWIMVAMMATGQLAIGLCGICAAAMSPFPFRQRVGIVAARPSWKVYPVAMLGSIVPLAIGLASAEGVAKAFPPDDTLIRFFDELTLDTAIVFVLFVGIAPALFEEILFRGFMQQRLVERWGVASGILVTSIVFGLFHVTPVAITAAMPLGFWFGYITWCSKSILPAILCHFFVNAGLNTWRMILKFLEPPEFLQNSFYVAAMLLGIVCFAIGCRSSFWTGQQTASEQLYPKP